MTQSGHCNSTAVVLHVEDGDATAYLLRYALRQQNADVAGLQHVPVIVFTSSVRAADREKSLALGAKHYFYKTGDLETFAAVSRQILEYFPPTLAPHKASLP